MNYFIFRIKAELTQYLTAQHSWSDSKADAQLLSEAEASDNCNEFSVDGWISGCGSLS